MAPARAAIVTGASSGIGLAIARVLGEEGHGLTIAARRPEKLEAAADGPARRTGSSCSRAPPTSPTRRRSSGSSTPTASATARLDVLVNNAGVGVGAPVGEMQTKYIDMQLTINLRSIFLFYRECRARCSRPPARSTATRWSSTPPRSPASAARRWLSVYSATKHGVVGWTEAMNKELGGDGIKSTALCPAFVDTPMTDFVKEHVPADEMIRPEDVAESVRYLLKLSPACVIPEFMFVRPGDAL